MTKLAESFQYKFRQEERAREAALAAAREEEERQKRPRPGIGTDGKPCPSGCEMVVKDVAWWAGRSRKLEEARACFPDAVLDEDGWLRDHPLRGVSA